MLKNTRFRSTANQRMVEMDSMEEYTWIQNNILLQHFPGMGKAKLLFMKTYLLVGTD